ncbi:hypothetical protein GO755_22585 [Spirosoma sp. HMF4905]|uniref:HEPN AbiJ-N-terminal domain-containing protein n=1 Tax=Spirosoma arboris TaxID=2682092 RepID=A0A7K1SGK9_9BACT|nr:hypothetical protein [Spirosoma arboris]MVM32844.1 hypothetical protein [Spirosoma arboris]
MDKLFSERYGYVVKQVQFGSLDRITKNFLWEEIYFFFMIQIEIDLEEDDSRAGKNLLMKIDREIFHNSLLVFPSNDPKQVIKSCENLVLNSSWYFIFDLVEMLVQNGSNVFESKSEYKKALKLFIKAFNKVLEEQKALYRLASTLVVPITSEAELSVLSDALEDTDKLPTVNGHLIKALKHLSNRTNPDYHNSIKESISALEALLGIIVADPKKDFSDAITLIKKRKVISVNMHLENTLKSMYRWASDEGAIRHADKGSDSVIDLDDAKLMLTTCSGLVSYLIAKSIKAGIEFQK